MHDKGFRSCLIPMTISQSTTSRVFAQTLGIGQAPAVLVIDFVVGFTDPAHFGGGNIRPAIERTVGLLALARRMGWPIAHTRVVFAR